MGFNKSLLAFNDIREAFEKALASTKGIRIQCISRGAAIGLRSRFNYFRQLDRESNSQVYEPGHHMHGRTPFDSLVLRIKPKGSPDDNYLYIEHRLVEDLNIEDLA